MGLKAALAEAAVEPLKIPKRRRRRKKKDVVKTLIPRPDLRESNKRAAKRQHDLHDKVEITLSQAHSINGFQYGPGTIKVPRHIAAVLQEQETRSRREYAKLRQDRAVIMGPGGRARDVAPETFEGDGLLNVPPVGRY